MNEYNLYFILPLVGHPYPTISSYCKNVYVSNDLRNLYVEMTKKHPSLDVYDYFYYDLKVFYIITLEYEICDIVKLMYDGKWKELLRRFPNVIDVINKTSGLVYYKKVKQGKSISKKLLLLNRDDNGYLLLQKEYANFGVNIEKDEEYLPALKEDEMNYIQSRLKDSFPKDFEIHQRKIKIRDLYRVTTI